MGFDVNQVCAGVMHIRDCMGVCMTLIEGERQALLVDTGYGVEDVSRFVHTLIGDKPLRVFLTHHHHDHTLGMRTLYALPDCEVSMLAPDAPAWEVYNGLSKRRTVLSQAISRGLSVDEQSFLAGTLEQPLTAVPGDIDLGGLTVRIIDCPGHTPGSAAVLVVERKLLLSADCWNPCTWVFFPEALGVRDYRRQVQLLQSYDFTHLLCSHQHALFPRSTFDAFVDHLTDDVLRAATPVSIGGYEHIDTRQASVAEGQILVFDWAKAQLE